MEVLEPKLVWANGCCYRFCDSNAWSSDQNFAPYQEEYNQEDDDMTSEAAGSSEIQIETTSDGKYKHSVSVPKLLHKFIVGFDGRIKKKLESETHTTLKIPKIGTKEENVDITGSSRAGVISCRQRIDLLIESSMDKIRFTHFVAIPLNNEEIINNYDKFKKEILNSPELAKDILEDYFITPQKLHLTIGMLKLLNDKEKTEAVEILNSCVEEVIKPFLKKDKPIEMVLQGLEIMNDDQTNVKVLYAEILKNDKLQELANKIFEYFINKGVMSPEYSDKVKLHMTLMKTSRVKKRNQKNYSRPASFNGVKILTKYKNHYFGKSQLKTINLAEISKREDMYYKTLADINLYE